MALHNFSSPFLPGFPGLFGSPGLYNPVGPSVPPYLPQSLQPPRPPEPPRQNRQTFSTPRPPLSPYQPPRAATPKPAGYSGYNQDTRYTRVNSGAPGSGKTSVHAVIDYDDDFDDGEYYDEPDLEALPPSQRHNPVPTVTPIQGPILVKNGSVPVVPLYSYPTINNGSLVQIPILWTALSLALGLEIRGDVIRGVPCIKRFHQLFCPTAGNSYPIDRIELFIDENKALMKRMYGEFQMTTEYGPPAREVFENQRRSRKTRAAKSKEKPKPSNSSAVPDPVKESEGSESYFGKLRQTRQSFRNNQSSDSGRMDACESKVEIVTPYWAANSAGKIRAIVNTQHFEQAIHQEVCSKTVTNRCSNDCGCEQKYKWHRLLAYDPDNDCKGIFMDWFLFPSCCVCRCNVN
ncbi:protein spaetzle 3-like [Macrosteles quadrilineatus]|uniref:protein spaetzle 3-like n=1 Tax=Macrosteles quadrilineatus TaxID=74068 RepID=UPI0023E32BD4|nr:protein spaetzle 3-like [Macrosteles quadrilineatus]XP_054267904.1 protein spaetzle 3-like [Macrosteles quadrilineatus]